jgi:hypothetical protein
MYSSPPKMKLCVVGHFEPYLEGVVFFTQAMLSEKLKALTGLV